MASSHPLGDEKDWVANDPVGVATNSAQRDEPDSEAESGDSDGSPNEIDLEKQKQLDQKKSELPALSRLQTQASQLTQVTTRPEEPQQQTRKLTWSQRINPLKRHPPPVPTERSVSREYSANIFSKITFQWVNPLMTVSSSLAQRGSSLNADHVDRLRTAA